MNSELNKLFIKKQGLAWDIGDTSKLSEDAMAEHIFDFGNWDDFKELIRILSINKAAEIFYKITNKSRVNLRPMTINFLNLYFKRNALEVIKPSKMEYY
ncbi:MAG: hypothetical protein WCK31_00940 [bacterium]